MFLSRRKILIYSFLSAALAAFHQIALSLSTKKSSPWDLSALSQLTPGSTIDLSATLPTDFARGGFFAVDPSGAQLPSGLTLHSDGKLQAAADCQNTHIENVIFSYSERSLI